MSASMSASSVEPIFIALRGRLPAVIAAARHLPLVQGGAHPVQALPATLVRDASGNTWSRVNGASGMSAGAAGSIHTIA